MSINGLQYLDELKEIGRIVALAREEMIKNIREGITTKELDDIGAAVLEKHGAVSAPISEYDFPGATCISVNPAVAHGIPGDYVIKRGDIVNVDVSAKKNGVFADTGATIVVGNDDPLKVKVCETAKTALDEALKKVKAGAKLNSIGRAIEREAKKNGLTVIQNLTGHGIGKKLHEEPHHILNYYFPYEPALMKEGMVLAIEPFVSTGAEFVEEENDGWTLSTRDKSYVAQYEHTVIVTRDKPIILTQLDEE